MIRLISITCLLIIAVCINIITNDAPGRAEIQMPPAFITIPEVTACNPAGRKKQNIKLPFFLNTWQTQTKCELYDRDHVAWAIIIFYIEWRKTFTDPDNKIKKMINNLTIEWDIHTQVVGPIYTIEGKRIKESEVVGLCKSPKEIWVWVGREHKISSSALIHELVHASLWMINNNPDADHEGSTRKGWDNMHTLFIKRVNKILNKEYDL